MSDQRLTNKQVTLLIDYWLETSKKNFRTMKYLYDGKHYSDALFFGHLILEKALKALVIKHVKKYPPRIHDLNRLAELASLNLSEKEKEFLAKITEFNLEGRYPDYKREFYQLCNKRYADRFYDDIIVYYKKLCRKVK